VNADLPIAFDGWGRMEIDLLCADSRVVVEIDGAQHLADPVAYRRDRRKDQLLQENGYLVLRYLAEDLAKELNSVLDGILRSLSSRRKSSPMAIPITVVRRGRAWAVSDRLQALWPALAAMEHRDDLQALAAQSVRNDVPCAWNHELTSPRHSTGTPEIRQRRQAIDRSE